MWAGSSCLKCCVVSSGVPLLSLWRVSPLCHYLLQWPWAVWLPAPWPCTLKEDLPKPLTQGRGACQSQGRDRKGTHEPQLLWAVRCSPFACWDTLDSGPSCCVCPLCCLTIPVPLSHLGLLAWQRNIFLAFQKMRDSLSFLCKGKLLALCRFCWGYNKTVGPHQIAVRHTAGCRQRGSLGSCLVLPLWKLLSETVIYLLFIQKALKLWVSVRYFCMEHEDCKKTSPKLCAIANDSADQHVKSQMF